MPFEPVDPKVNFPELEQRILVFWDDADVFDRSMGHRADGPRWVFYEGPPTANAQPGLHHVEPRTFKDVFPRYKTMTGHFVQRKGGWDCHGLPVEIEVEKEIGTSGKRDIEAFGVAAFNQRCRESVQRYVGEFERLTKRIGFWIDTDQAYWTMHTPYIESVWWSLKQLHARGLLVQDYKVTAYCPRCGTALSDAEVAQGYETVSDPSVFVRLPFVDATDPSLEGASLIVWTTTPWTLPANEGVAVDPSAEYVVVDRDGERLVVGASLRARVLGETGTVVRTLAGSDLLGLHYRPPYPNVEGAHAVVPGDFVSMDEGTGLVHLAPAFGPDDLDTGRVEGWPVYKPVGDDGRFTELGPTFVRGDFVKDADPKIVEDLRERGILLSSGTIEHAYPFCWRCHTPLLYYARTSWYIRTTAVKDRLLEVNASVDWYPPHIRDGRYGNWLENNVDWALSRERYWGTPLPIWRCEAGHETVIGSLHELGGLAGNDLSSLDPHRPGIDDVTFACPTCGARAERVPEVIDTWYDSGAMPFAQWGYHPELGRGIEAFERNFPADFISEAIDQTRGWFYTLMAEGVLHFDATAYRSVVCLGLILDAEGRKMSKSLGNSIDPFDVLDRHGADTLRWFLLTNGSPWSDRRVSFEALDEIVRQFLLTLWNVYAFFVTYANANGFDPSVASAVSKASAAPSIMDRWVRSRLADTVREARERLESYDATGAGRRIQAFVDELSNWFVRRSRRRFWNPGGVADPDADAASATLHHCLVTVATLLAPFTPFVAEELWRNLAAGRDGRPDSVHLADYPEPDTRDRDPSLDASMALARDVVELGRRVRAQTKTKTRQPLPEAVLHVPGRHTELDDLLDVIADELNVRSVRFAEMETFGAWRVKPSYRLLGPRLGPRVNDLAAALARDDGTVAARLAAGETVEIEIGDGSPISISPDEVDLAQEVMEGWGVASEGGVTVALELEITPELRLEGLARELVRLLQDARKAAGLAVSDRIVAGVIAEGEIAAALDAHRDEIAGEVLAVRLVSGSVENGTYRQVSDLDGAPVTIELAKD
jgi:isoleucyl-tRNA synthetase